MRKLSMLGTIMLILMACHTNSEQKKPNTADLSSNPFMHASTLPFQAPDFSKIKGSDYGPALEEGIKQQLTEIEKIAGNTDAPTFENTLVALEKSGQLLRRVYAVFNMVSGANTDSVLQKLSEEIAPKMAAQLDAIYLNEKLYERFKTIYQKKDKLNLDKESAKLLEYYQIQFTRYGANLSKEDKTKLKKLNEEEAGLAAKYTNQLLAAAKAGAYVADSKEALKGLSEGAINSASQDAEAVGKKGKWLLSLRNTTQQPAFQSLENRETRRQLYEASWTRAEKGDNNDTRAIIKRLARLRAGKAQLLGFPNYAAWALQDQMAVTPEAVQSFLKKLIPAATAQARKEAAELQSIIDREKGGFTLEPWDWNFYSEKVRKAKYDLDESQTRPYFEIFNVLENGIFYAANQLYGLTFKRRSDIPVYNNDLRVYTVYDKDSSELGLFYCDYFKRDNKSGGAWMSNVVDQSKLLNTKPVIYNVCNFTKPAAGEPALISFDDVTTMFHEFGHGLHGLFANQTYPSLSGANVARDFVELPSQFNEHWALEPKVFQNYAKHYKTGNSMPKDLVEKIKKSQKFNQGFAFTEILAAADLDMEWHTITTKDSIKSVDDFEAAALNRTNLNLSQVPPRYRSSYFLHIWSNGYAAGYYAYSWTEMLEENAYNWFKENGGMTRANGQRFRDMILSRGNTEEYNKMFYDFCGHKPDLQPMLEARGLNNK